ncbi:hypothetical protein HPB49_009871 [Dermacentor silvarum]|uniref:Uncharacterized protein n=1 Tax=Dermacentor silvarum TaxID=543639 RepID=A0ACB8DZP9_DERSI|nr:hypothetical protein HPB49_009871 [Dermacentor silvarum]
MSQASSETPEPDTHITQRPNSLTTPTQASIVNLVDKALEQKLSAFTATITPTIEESIMKHPPNSYDEWARTLIKLKQEVTKTISTNPETPAVDQHLLHLWDARHQLTRQWKRQKLNRKLRQRAEVTAQAEEYATKLSKENWFAKCDALTGTLHTASAWHLLRYLMDPEQSRGAARRNLQRASHANAGDTAQLFRDLEDKYINTSVSADHVSAFNGTANPEMDRDFTTAEIRVASKRSLPPEWQQDIITRPLPRNMHPVHHENRRAARAKAYKYSDHAGAFFVDAAGPMHNRSTATVVQRGQVVDCISATGIDITAMEEAGIALAMRNPRATFVLTDSQAALRPIVRRVSGNSCCGYHGTREFEAMRLLMPPPKSFYTGAPPIPPQHNFSLTRTILSPFFHILRSCNTSG